MSLTNTNIPSAASDVVGVFDQGFNQVFPLARPIKATIDESAKAMEHPVETGVVITDHIIFQPNEIELSMILPSGEYRSVYQQIEQIYKAATVLSVQTRAATYQNMFIYRMPHQEDVELFDTISMFIRMRQILIIAPAAQSLPATSVKNPTDQSTITNGLQQPGITQALPPPSTFEEADGPIPTLPAGAPLPTPNDNSYSNYPSTDLPIVSLTQTQIEQLLNASHVPGGIQ